MHMCAAPPEPLQVAGHVRRGSAAQIPFLLISLHFFISSPAGGVPSTVLDPTSPQFVLSTVPPLSWKDLF